MILTHHQTELLMCLFDRLFTEHPEHSEESKEFSKNIPVDELEELYDLYDHMVQAVVSYELSDEAFDMRNSLGFQGHLDFGEEN